MDEKKLEEKANEEYPLQTDGHIIGRYAYKKGYKDAIKEFLKGLWHPYTEIPKTNIGSAIVCYNGGRVQSQTVTFLRSQLKDYGKYSYIKCWCYIDDLLTKEGGNHE